jgi:signal recognition particle GTPase
MFEVPFQLTNPYTAKDNDFDVVLIDTAGRMQDNEVRELAPYLSRS